MKNQYAADLGDGQAVSTQFLVREKEIRTSARTGKSWLEMSLGDRSGSIPGKMWDGFEAAAKTFERDDVVRVRGRVKLYNGRAELTLEQIVPVAEGGYDLDDFLPATQADVEKLFSGLGTAIAGMRNPWLQKLLSSVVEDPAVAPLLKRAPAAMSMHHAYLGGLLEHVSSLIGLATAVAAHYPELDPDLLLAGVVLHDIGKIDELRFARAIDYSDEGRLLGHITMGAILVREKCRTIAGFPEPLATLVEHMILSHHGSYEFGSPSLPQFPEAVVLHYLDDMDSKMAAMRGSLAASGSAAGPWTDRSPALRRSILRVREFLSEASGGPSDQPAARTGARPAPQKKG